MPHQKSTVLSVCFICRRSAYLEAIVTQHCRLFTYFSGIVPSYRIRKWVNWYADCLSLKPFQNELCRWLSIGACIPFLNVMHCSAWGRWGGCANLMWDQSWFSHWQNFHWIQGEFFIRSRPTSWSPLLTLPSLSELHRLPRAYQWLPFPSLLFYYLGCVLSPCPDTFI